MAICIEMFKYLLEIHHTGITQDITVFDMEHFDTICIFLDILNRVLLAHNGPINIHLKENQRRVGIRQEDVIHFFAFVMASELHFRATGNYLGKLHVVVMVTERYTCCLHDLSGFVKDFTHKFCFFHVTGTGLTGLNQIFHT